MSTQNPRPHLPRGQRGVAGVLLVVFVGMALIVLSVGVIRTVRSTQERTLATHVTTPAQAAGWYGVEVIRRYLDSVHAETVKAWHESGSISPAAPMDLEIGSAEALNFSARITDVTKLSPDPDDLAYQVTAHVDAQAGTGAVAATAPIEVVYQLALRSVPPDDVPAGPPTYDFFRDLEITGDIEFSGAEHSVINVQGSVTIDATNFSGAAEVNATGDVNINSGVKMHQIWSNGEVNLTQGADSELVMARGPVLLSGGGIHGQVRSNADVRFLSSEAQLVETKGSLIVGVDGESCLLPPLGNRDGTYVGEAQVEHDIMWYSCGGGGKRLSANNDIRYHGATRYHTGSTGGDDYRSEQHIRAGRNIEVRSAESVGRFTAKRDILQLFNPDPATMAGAVPFTRFCAQNDLTITYKNWAMGEGWYGNQKFYPTATARCEDPNVDSWNCPNDAMLRPLPAPGTLCDFSFPPAAVDPVPEFTITPPTVDARVLKPDAHLAFEHDEDGEVKITARNLQGVPNGVYTLGYEVTATATYPDQLCLSASIDRSEAPDSTTRQRRCLAPVRKICENDGNVSCFSYDADTETWTVGRPFGDHSAAADTIARGFMWFEGNLVVGRTAFVGAFIATGNIHVEGNRIHSANYAEYALLCANAPIPDVGNGHRESPDLLGLYPRNLCNSDGTIVYTKLGNVALIAGSYDGGTFSGGNITTSGGVRLDGSVLAGNQVVTSGHTTINGHLVGAGQGTPLPPGMSSGELGNTTDLIWDPKGEFNPNDDPCMAGGCDETNAARVRWARYR